MDATTRKTDGFNKRLAEFLLQMKRLQFKTSLVAAKRTLELMRELLAISKHEDHLSLIDHVKEIGSRMITAKPQELVVGNMVRRVLHLIREVAAEEGATVAEPLSTSDMPSDMRTPHPPRPVSLLTLLDSQQRAAPVTPAPARAPETASTSPTAVGNPLDLNTQRSRKKAKVWPGKPKVLDLVSELLEEMELAEDAIVDKATEHIHANEMILTFGLSQTTLLFLLKAAERRSFQVVVAEGAPMLRGLTMARQLQEANIPTLVIPDTCIFALMARVNKVLVGAQAVLATGGALSQSGSRLVALAAKHHRVPFVVVTGLYKLSPLFPHDPHVTFSDFNSPSAFADRRLKSSTLRVTEDGQYKEESLQLPCPMVDYIEPELIDLLITDTGGYTPSYIYRLLSEYYTREDYVLSKVLLDRMVGH